jgi:hypothetical protein
VRALHSGLCLAVDLPSAECTASRAQSTNCALLLTCLLQSAEPHVLSEAEAEAAERMVSMGTCASIRHLARKPAEAIDEVRCLWTRAVVGSEQK